MESGPNESQHFPTIGQPIRRKEDLRLVTGLGRFSDDFNLEGQVFAAFVRSRDGVEAFLEPRTTVTDTTVVLVASSGEWTRRRIDGAKGASAFAKRHHIPLYDVASVGYPARMRQWNRRQDAD